MFIVSLRWLELITYIVYVHLLSIRWNKWCKNHVSNKQKQKKWNSAKAIPIKNSVQMRACYQTAGLPGRQLEQQFPQYARSTIYKYVNMPTNDITPYDKCRGNTGRVEKFQRWKDLEKKFANFAQECWPLYLKTRALIERSATC